MTIHHFLRLLGENERYRNVLRALRGDENLLDRHTYENIVYGNGDDQRAQEMRGIITCGLPDRKVKQSRSRMKKRGFVHRQEV